MRTIVVTDIRRPPADVVARLAVHGAATAHEAQGRTGSLGADIVPRVPGSRIAGPAVTALCWPGDNLMVHVAVEQVRPGDVLVVTTTAPSTDGMFGELLATSLRARGGVGVVLTTGVRDTAALREMGFPAWSRAVSVQGTVKSTPGAVNVPVPIGAALVHPGDVVVADDDGVVVVPRDAAAEVAEACEQRTEKETETRGELASGTLGLDYYGLRDQLGRLGIEWVPQPPPE